jgi:glutamate 5-kinase
MPVALQAPKSSKHLALKKARRVVIKIGSNIMSHKGNGLQTDLISDWIQQLSLAKNHKKYEFLIVSSGAIAEGMKRLNWGSRPRELYKLQAAAAVGQMGLIQTYETHLRHHGLASAQVLLTHADLADRERYLNARSTLLSLLDHDVIPIINENDVVANQEIKVGDNDNLSALVANLVGADLLIILTDQQGLYNADPRKDTNAQLLSQVIAGAKELEKIAGGPGATVGTGGMLTKVQAAKRASRSGANTVIAAGYIPSILTKILAGQVVGTLLTAPTKKQQARKVWMFNHLQVCGQVYIDTGAATQLLQKGASLLFVGVHQVRGKFLRGEVISIHTLAGQEIARGLANYNDIETRLLCRKPSHAIESTIGYVTDLEMIHRDNMVLL